jgi:hypothetical protein
MLLLVVTAAFLIPRTYSERVQIYPHKTIHPSHGIPSVTTPLLDPNFCQINNLVFAA